MLYVSNHPIMKFIWKQLTRESILLSKNARGFLSFMKNFLPAVFQTQNTFILFFKFIFIKFIGLIFVKRNIYVSTTPFYDTWSSRCIACPPPKVKSSFVTIYFTPCTLYYPRTPLSSGSHHTCLCLWVFVFLVRSFLAFSFISHMGVKLYGS